MPSTPLSAKQTRKAVHDLADHFERLDRACGAMYTRVQALERRCEPNANFLGRVRWLLFGTVR